MSRGARCTWRARSTWRGTHATSSRPVRSSSAAAAERRPITSRRWWTASVRSCRAISASRARAISCRTRSGWMMRAGEQACGRRRGDALRAPLALGREDRAQRVRHLRGDRAAARRRCDGDARGRERAQGRRRRRGKRPRRPARAEPHGRAHDEPPHRAAHRDGDGHALLLSRSQSPRHAERLARRVGDGTAQSCSSSRAIRRRWARIPTRPRCSTSIRSDSRIS